MLIKNLAFLDNIALPYFTLSVWISCHVKKDIWERPCQVLFFMYEAQFIWELFKESVVWLGVFLFFAAPNKNQVTVWLLWLVLSSSTSTWVAWLILRLCYRFDNSFHVTSNIPRFASKVGCSTFWLLFIFFILILDVNNFFNLFIINLHASLLFALLLVSLFVQFI